MMGEVRIRVLGGKDSPAPAKSHRVGELFTPERRGPAARYRGGRKDGMRVNTRFTALTRLGFAARGLLYIVIALLVFRSGRSEDIGGALAELGRSGGDPCCWRLLPVSSLTVCGALRTQRSTSMGMMQGRRALANVSPRPAAERSI